MKNWIVPLAIVGILEALKHLAGFGVAVSIAMLIAGFCIGRLYEAGGEPPKDTSHD